MKSMIIVRIIRFRRRARERYESVDERRIALAPHPRVHAPHRRPHHQPQVIDAEPFAEQLVLRVDHVSVRVLRESRVQPVTRLARLAMPDAVREDDVVLRCVEELARPEQLAAERPTREAAARPRRAVQYDDRVPNDARCVALWLSERDVVNPQLRQRLAALELEVANDIIGAGECLRAGRNPERQQRDDGGDVA
jgi:hypothetical protein